MNAPLVEQFLPPEPLDFFLQWYEEAIACGIVLPNAMTLATAGADAKPSARMVLLKGVDRRGFVFYTNYESRKGCELRDNPHAALVFHWQAQERQVRVEGTVQKISERESDEYFRTRPRGSQIGAAISPQSRVIAGREELLARFSHAEKEFETSEVPRPPGWGGYMLTPSVVEFWQGGPDRCHDRIAYRRSPGGAWKMERLAP